MTKLTESQKAALDYVTQYARRREEPADLVIREILSMSDVSRESFETAVERLKTYARVALHFHPDRPDSEGNTVAEALLVQGCYKSQFETGLSSGSVSAYPGGERDEWERRMFGGAYHRSGASNSERPKYGALDLMLHADGPSPRFGSCYALLAPPVSKRSTFTYLDSHDDPPEKGTYDGFKDIIAALLKEIFFRDYALGEHHLTPRKFIDHLLADMAPGAEDPSVRLPSRNLNHYVEAQVHGEVGLAEDVDVIVADPSFKETRAGDLLEEISSRYSVKLLWHMGFRLNSDDVPSDFRGPTMPTLARRIARDGFIDASTIGAAAVDLKRSPESWSDRGAYKEVLQELKLLWHVLVKFGNPIKAMPFEEGR